MPKSKYATDRERSLFSEMWSMTKNEPLIYYILWTYAPDQLTDGESIKTFADLEKRYACMEGRSEDALRKSLDGEKAKQLIRYLYKRLDFKRDTELLNRYYDLAMGGDVQALKAYMEFKKKYFADNEVDELKQIISGANIADSEDNEDDFEMVGVM